MEGLEDEHTRTLRRFGYPSLVSQVQIVADGYSYALTGLKMYLHIRKSKSQLCSLRRGVGRGKAGDAFGKLFCVGGRRTISRILNLE